MCLIRPKSSPIESNFRNCVVASSCMLLSSVQTPATMDGKNSNCNKNHSILVLGPFLHSKTLNRRSKANHPQSSIYTINLLKKLLEI